MHLDVVEAFTLAEVVVIRGREEPRAVSANDGLQVTAMDVECQSFESVHFCFASPSLSQNFLEKIRWSDLPKVEFAKIRKRDLGEKERRGERIQEPRRN